VALIHYPVLNKNGEIIASAVTNLDLHDIARAVRTYGAEAFYVVTPLEDQRALVGKILAHWIEGYGARYNPKRGEALALIDIQASLDDVCRAIATREDRRPKVVATSARIQVGNVSCGKLRDLMADGEPYLLAFGTAWGLAPDFLQAADYILDPIGGHNDYNHLAVRSAAAIVLDRLVGNSH
jgi:hypothetical protein